MKLTSNGYRALLGMAAAVAAFSSHPAAAQAAAPAACVLHVSGMVTPPLPRPSLFVVVRGPLEDPSDPATRAFQYTSITRALALSDAELRSLFPAGTDVQIVRHSTGVPRDVARRGRTPIYPHQEGCYADLVVAEVMGVFPSGRGGLVGNALAGGNRLEVVFSLRRFDSPGSRPAIAFSRHSGVFTPAPAGETTAGLAVRAAAATSEAFAKFAEEQARRGAADRAR